MYIIGFWIYNVKTNISLRNKVETYLTFRPSNMDFVDGRVVWSHDPLKMFVPSCKLAALLAEGKRGCVFKSSVAGEQMK